MSKLKVLCFGLSVDGFGAGPGQSLENPMGEGGMLLHDWVFPTKFFQSTHGDMFEGQGSEGSTGIDNDFAERGFENIGAWILGRNMFGPVRGPWPDESWKGWWGDNPPYHCPVYVLTHHPRPTLEMQGGTTFYFTSEGIETVLEKAKKAAGGKDVRLGGGVETVKQFLKAKLIDEIHLAISPHPLGKGENLFADINLPALGYECSKYMPSEKVSHIVFKKKP